MKNKYFELEKTGRKWKVGEYSDEWIFKRTFNRKWKPIAAVEVYKSGGKWKDYCKRISEEPCHRNEPVHVKEVILKANSEIKKLEPTCNEIADYAEHLYANNHDHGIVTLSNGNDYFQKIHDTWYSELKQGGRVNIDLGCKGYHLMLTKDTYQEFVDFVKDKRGSPKES
jgi:hypothetical protein